MDETMQRNGYRMHEFGDSVFLQRSWTEPVQRLKHNNAAVVAP
jgi:hypothetical protein